MNYRPPEDAHFVAKRRQYIKQKNKTRKILLSVLCIAILAVWIMIIIALKRFTSDYSEEVTTEAVTATETEPIPTETTHTGMYGGETVPLEISASDIEKGTLILVSDHLGHSVPEEIPPLTTVWGNKSPTYYVASSSLKLASDAFSAADRMLCAYNSDNNNSDYQITMGYAEKDSPICCAEHSTGYAFDVNVYTKNGASLRLAEAGNTDAIYSWIYDNAHKYGFVLRYGVDKSGVTGMPQDADHFRYVGVGHSQYMAEKGLSLEEYIGELQKSRYGEKHLEFSYDGVLYEVFYVSFSEGEESVTVEIPKDVSYTISGDNISGTIVTLYK